MLRLLVLVLVLANAGYFAWAQGWLRDWGLAPASPSEPHHVQQQIRPDAVRILPAGEARRGGAETVAAADHPAGITLRPGRAPLTGDKR